MRRNKKVDKNKNQAEKKKDKKRIKKIGSDLGHNAVTVRLYWAGDNLDE